MSTIWITPHLDTRGLYSYNATIKDGSLKIWLNLIDYGQGRYRLEWSIERGTTRGQLGKRQRQAAEALKAELEPLFLDAIRAAGFSESIDPIFHHSRWMRA